MRLFSISLGELPPRPSVVNHVPVRISSVLKLPFLLPSQGLSDWLVVTLSNICYAVVHVKPGSKSLCESVCLAIFVAITIVLGVGTRGIMPQIITGTQSLVFGELLKSERKGHYRSVGS